MQGLIQRYRELADGRMAELLPPEGSEPRVLTEAMRYSALSPGKRLRASLTMLSAELFGAEAEVALDAGCAIEFIHTFSLIHDDLPAIDDDDLRRGRPTCHVKFGEAAAVLAGDSLFALAFEILGRYSQSICGLVAKASGWAGLAGGEMMDVLAEGKPVTKEKVAAIHDLKTAALFGASCEVGAILGGATREEQQVMHRFGTRIGHAFQIVDDILNETASAEVLGKSAGSDRERQKATYPAVYGLDASRLLAASSAEGAIDQLRQLDPARISESIADSLCSLARESLQRAY